MSKIRDAPINLHLFIGKYVNKKYHDLEFYQET